jgi:glycine cleavage system aminomethyltransferase T
MKTHEEVFAIRHSVAVSRMQHVQSRCLRGAGVYEALDRVVPAALHLRDAQMIQSLLLDDDGYVFADILLGCDGEEFFLLAEGPDAAQLDGYLHKHLKGTGDIEMEDTGASHVLLGIDGPYAWELLGLLIGPDIYSLPSLTFFHSDLGLCFRAGKTGEYGYGVLVAKEDAEGLMAALLERGAEMDVATATLESLDQCALDSWYFNIRREGREPATPIELQLQWRLSYRKTYVGSEALLRRRQEGPRQRLTCLVADRPLEVGSSVLLRGSVVGRIVNACYSPIREDWVALALLDVAWAHPGIGAFRAEAGGEHVPMRSLSPPLLNNRSLHVNPQVHSYRTRGEFEFPPLPRG